MAPTPTANQSRFPCVIPAACPTGACRAAHRAAATGTRRSPPRTAGSSGTAWPAAQTAELSRDCFFAGRALRVSAEVSPPSRPHGRSRGSRRRPPRPSRDRRCLRKVTLALTSASSGRPSSDPMNWRRSPSDIVRDEVRPVMVRFTQTMFPHVSSANPAPGGRRPAVRCGACVAASCPPRRPTRSPTTSTPPPPEALLEPSYNVAPTNDVYAVLADGGVRRVDAFHWGLVPDLGQGPQGRVEDDQRPGRDARHQERLQAGAQAAPLPHPGRRLLRVDEGAGRQAEAAVLHPPTRRRALRLRRPVGGVEGPQGRRGQPHGDPLRSCTIITTTPNETMAKIHDRMPVILPPSAWDEWLDPDNDDIETLGKLLVPAPASLTELRPVSTEVNNVRNKGAELAAEIPADQIIVAEPDRRLIRRAGPRRRGRPPAAPSVGARRPRRGCRGRDRGRPGRTTGRPRCRWG